jgi:hypothetical protein
MDGTNPSLVIPPGLPQRRKILSLRYMGYESEEISQILGISVGSVQAQLNAAITASSDKERMNVVREAEMSKLEEIEEAFFPAATGEAHDGEGNPIPAQASAAKVVLDVMDRRAKLLGIDKAQPPQNNTHLTLIQILSQLPPALDSSPLLPERKLDGVTTQSPSFSREATDA